MGFILNIDTAVETASVCLSEGATAVAVKVNPAQKDSAAWIHTAIRQLMLEQQIKFDALSAIAVSAGPGSYTGLRVGMATAKGLCYATGLPLLSINTLQMMAAAAMEEPTDLLCPMIDARRMEVFTALYTPALEEVMAAHPLVLQPDSFQAMLQKKSITFFGNGSNKFQNLIHQNTNACFKHIIVNATHMAILANSCFLQEKFTNLAYSEPCYGKEFFTNARNI